MRNYLSYTSISISISSVKYKTRTRSIVFIFILVLVLVLVLVGVMFGLGIKSPIEKDQSLASSALVTSLKTSFQENFYTPAEPIAIGSNSDFISYGFPGSGTKTDPYRIEGLNITARIDWTELISISDVTAYFHIKNNYLDGLGGQGWGLVLNNIMTAVIEQNIVINTGNGISLWYLDWECL